MKIKLSEPDPTPGTWYQKLGPFLWYDCLCALWMVLLTCYVEVFTRAPVIQVEDIAKRTGQVAILTGGPRGLALGLIKRLLQLDYTIIMGVRNMDDSKKRLKEFAQSNPQLSMSNVRLLEMDLMALTSRSLRRQSETRLISKRVSLYYGKPTSVRKFAEDVNKHVPRIDLLLCNAANMREPYVLTEDGFESQFQVNYLSQFLLTQLLLEKLKRTAAAKASPCQIIYTSSILHEAGDFYFDELEKPKVYTRNKFYYPSKLCQVAGMLYLSKKLEEDKAQVNCYAVHPGLIPTEIWYTGMGPLTMLIGNVFRPFFRTIESGADTILWPTFSPEFQSQGGIYMANGMVRKASDEARSEENQYKLYEKSLQLLKANYSLTY